MKPVDINKLSPMMRHYLEVKTRYPGVILMYRLGDFYEMFFDDAETVSRELELTLTGRDCGLAERAPMCGVPYHAVDTYISRLINKGYKVAICEQLTEPGGKGLVERDVVRVVTPGTIMEDSILEEGRNNYLASVYECAEGFGLAYADLSTGEFVAGQCTGANALEEVEGLLGSIHPAEIICNAGAQRFLAVETLSRPRGTPFFDYAYAADTANQTLCEQFKVATLVAFDCDELPLGVQSAGALMTYLSETQKRALGHFTKLKPLIHREFMVFDTATRRNLELTETIRDRRKNGTLLWLLDKTCTSMGARALRKAIDRPLTQSIAINERLNAVDELTKKVRIRADLLNTLPCIRDLERLAGKVAYGSVNPRDMLSIGSTLLVLPVLRNTLKDAKSALLIRLAASIATFPAECETLARAIAENPPQTMADGGYIAAGYSTELDQLRDIKTSAISWLKELEERERESTGIKNLKVGYNHVFGYYLEVTKLNMGMVPDQYIRKQTLANAERYKTQELADLEGRILGAHDRAVRIEAKLFEDLRTMIGAIVPDLISTAGAIAALDVLLSFAVVSINNHYIKPTINERIKQIRIECGRHPVVEQLLPSGRFTPNDTMLNADTHKTMIITGPNMAGKSTYMRQVALIVLMAHMGCFVPADKAEISLTDRIFTRVGASDDLALAQSTFMVEMIEVANILHNATPQSLLIMDEIGRGTSTCDGLSIAWSVMEYVNNVVGAKTLFATHYHELTDLEGKLSGVVNYRILVNEVGEKVVFLHRIARGGTNKSFGIEVASLAGVPEEVCRRAKEIAGQLEKQSHGDIDTIVDHSMGGVSHTQMSFFVEKDEQAESIVKILKETSIDNLTPMQSMLILSDLVERAKKK